MAVGLVRVDQGEKDEEAEEKESLEHLTVLSSLQAHHPPVLLKLQHLLNSCCCVPNLSLMNFSKVYLFII